MSSEAATAALRARSVARQHMLLKHMRLRKQPITVKDAAEILILSIAQTKVHITSMREQGLVYIAEWRPSRGDHGQPTMYLRPRLADEQDAPYPPKKTNTEVQRGSRARRKERDPVGHEIHLARQRAVRRRKLPVEPLAALFGPRK